MSTPIIHTSFTIDRTYPTTVARVFRAWSDATKKRRWFAEGEGFTVQSHELDFRVGGHERCAFRPDGGPPMALEVVYLDIVKNERIVYGYSMTIDGAPLSGSLATIELSTTEGGTLLRVTEHTAYLDGKDGGADRREGTQQLLEALAGELQAHD